MKRLLPAILVLAAGCEGVITQGDPVVVPPAPVAPLVKTCTSRRAGLPARMRMLWSAAYLQEISTHLGPEAAQLADSVGLSPATTKTFPFQTAGSLLTDLTIDSLVTSADALAVWALSTDVHAMSVFGCNARVTVGADAEACFVHFLKTKGARLLRRNLSEAEVADQLAFFKAESLKGETDGQQEGFRQGLANLLVHPDFLYVRDVPVGQSPTLTPFSIASRLSFALTGAGPDDELFTAAQDGSLAQPKVLKAQVERLLKTPAAQAQQLGFYRQWLGYGQLSMAYSPGFLNGLDATTLKDSAIAELDGFVTDQTWNRGGTASDLLTSRATAPLSPVLAQIYGAKAGDISLPVARAGLLTRVGLIASGNDNWHIVARGLPVLQNFLCRDLAPPSFSVAAAAMQAESLKVSNLDRISSVTSAANCQSCHKQINPLGGARSDFDAIGRSVKVEQHYNGGVLDFEVPVVANADLTPVLGFASAGGSVGLSKALAASSEFQACFATQYVRHVLGRREDADGCLAEDAATTLVKGGSILETMTAVMTSPELVLWRN